MAIPLVALLPCSTCASVHLLQPNGWLELRIAPSNHGTSACRHRADAHNLLRQLLSGARQAKSGDVKGVLLTIEPGSTFSTAGDVNELVKALSYGPAVVRDYLQTECALAAQLHDLAQTKPVVALADGVLTGTSAAFFLAASQRVSTAATVLSVPGCVIGVCPGGGLLDLCSSGVAMPPGLGLLTLLTGGRISAGHAAEGSAPAPVQVATHTCATEEALWQLRGRLLSEQPEFHEATISGLARGRAGAMVDGVNTYAVAAVERVVSNTHVLRNDAAARIDAIQESLKEEAAAAAACDVEAAAWLREQSEALERGCPAAQIVTYAALRRAALSRQLAYACIDGSAPTSTAAGTRCECATSMRRRSLGMELAANTVLASRADFIEGTSCAIGLRCGSTPVWQHASRQEAAADPQVTELVACVLGALPFVPEVERAGARPHLDTVSRT